jgi:hypothetical protein
MTTVGTNTWGVIISTGTNAGAPSGDIAYFLCNDVQRTLKTKDKTDHYASQTAVTIPLGQLYYDVRLNNTVYYAKTLSNVNSYHALLHSWEKGQTKVYLWCKDSAGTYLDFIIGSTTYDYLPCCVKEVVDGLRNSKLIATIRVEETA